MNRLLRLQLVALSDISAIIALEPSSLELPAFEAPQKIIRRGARSRLGPCCARLSSRAAWPSWLHSAAFHCENGPAASSNRPRGLLGRCSVRWERDLSGWILCSLIGLTGALISSLIRARTIASFEFPRLAFLRLAAAANAMHDFPLHDMPTTIYPADSPCNL